jgi:predicted O-methyltransferase YrrM
MTEATWAAVDRYLGALFPDPDGALAVAVAEAERAGLPPIHVPAALGRLLELLARLQQAERILEIGTLAGYSTLWLARALPANGRLVSLELNPHHAAVARANLERAGLADRVEIRIGPALAALAELIGDGSPPFDLIFIDADKPTYADYLAASLRLSRPGTLIVADNVIRNGAVADAASPDPNVQGVRRFLAALAAQPGLVTTVLQTVGAKGYDGVALALVVAEGR